MLILEFATTIDAGTMLGLMQILQLLFIAYMVFLTAPKMLMFCLQISVEKEESGKKISFYKGLKLFWTNPKKMKSLQKDHTIPKIE